MLKSVAMTGCSSRGSWRRRVFGTETETIIAAATASRGDCGHGGGDRSRGLCRRGLVPMTPLISLAIGFAIAVVVIIGGICGDSMGFAPKKNHLED
jgi:hypothetical protein